MAFESRSGRASVCGDTTAKLRLIDTAVDERRGFVESPFGVIKLVMRPLIPKELLPASETKLVPGDAVVDIRKVLFEFLIANELKYAGFEQPKLRSQEHMFSRPDVSGFTLVSMSPPTAIEHVKSWVLIRCCSRGARFGPVYAEDATTGKLVIAAAMESADPRLVKEFRIRMSLSVP